MATRWSTIASPKTCAPVRPLSLAPCLLLASLFAEWPFPVTYSTAPRFSSERLASIHCQTASCLTRIPGNEEDPPLRP